MRSLIKFHQYRRFNRDVWGRLVRVSPSPRMEKIFSSILFPFKRKFKVRRFNRSSSYKINLESKQFYKTFYCVRTASSMTRMVKSNYNFESDLISFLYRALYCDSTYAATILLKKGVVVVSGKVVNRRCSLNEGDYVKLDKIPYVPTELQLMNGFPSSRFEISFPLGTTVYYNNIF